MGGLSIWHWLIVLLIVLVIFGTKKLGNIGSDLGKAVRDFKKGLNGDEDKSKSAGDEGQRLKADEPAADEAKASRDESSQPRSGP